MECVYFVCVCVYVDIYSTCVWLNISVCVQIHIYVRASVRVHIHIFECFQHPVHFWEFARRSFAWKAVRRPSPKRTSKAGVKGSRSPETDPPSCITPGPCCPPPLALPSSPVWQLQVPPNSQKLRSQLWSAWTCGRDTGCCQKACDGRREHGSSDFPSERHCTGSSGTGKACDLCDRGEPG